MALIQSCVVCGQGSHRTEWAKSAKGKTGTIYVSCDNHTAEEIQAAVVKEEAPPVPVTQGSVKPGRALTPADPKKAAQLAGLGMAKQRQAEQTKAVVGTAVSTKAPAPVAPKAETPATPAVPPATKV